MFFDKSLLWSCCSPPPPRMLSQWFLEPPLAACVSSSSGVTCLVVVVSKVLGIHLVLVVFLMLDSVNGFFNQKGKKCRFHGQTASRNGSLLSCKGKGEDTAQVCEWLRGEPRAWPSSLVCGLPRQENTNKQHGEHVGRFFVLTEDTLSSVTAVDFSSFSQPGCGSLFDLSWIFIPVLRFFTFLRVAKNNNNNNRAFV